MPSVLTKIQQTSPFPWVIALRVIAGGIFVAMGALPKFTDETAQENVTKMLELGNMPAPGTFIYLVALGELIAGLLMLSGLLARIGGGLGVLLMLGALYTHLSVDFTQLPHPDQVPPHPMPVITILLSAAVTILGGGRWSVDRMLTAKSTGAPASPPPPAA